MQNVPWLRDRQVFMFIGRLDPWQKGLDLLVEAFAHAGLRDAALVLVGPDYRGSRRALATLAERLGISSQRGVHRAGIWSRTERTCSRQPTCSCIRRDGKACRCRCWRRQLRASRA